MYSITPMMLTKKINIRAVITLTHKSDLSKRYSSLKKVYEMPSALGPKG